MYRRYTTDLLVSRLREAGMMIAIEGTTARARGAGRLKSIDITTAPHPGFATDLQAQLMALMAVASGTSIILCASHAS